MVFGYIYFIYEEVMIQKKKKKNGFNKRLIKIKQYLIISKFVL